MTNEQKAVLDGLAKRGQLTPDAVVEEAALPDSPLHSMFTWDDSLAAKRWRLEEARGIITSVTVIIERESREIQVVRYVRDPKRLAQRAGLRGRDNVEAEDERNGRIADLQELERLEAIVDRVGGLVDALGTKKASTMKPAFERVERGVAVLRQRVGPPPA